MGSPKNNNLNRFTSLPVLLDLLIKKRLVFSNPKFWDDKNDVELLKIYGKAKRKKILALCFLKDFETIYHWKAFAGGVGGCCVEFDKVKLKKLLSAHKKNGVRYRQVAYKRLCEEIDDRVGMIPFQKRWPYRFEKEFRVIWEGNTDSHAIEIADLTMITKITFTQLMPKPIFVAIRNFLKENLKIAAETKINQSTVFENKCWIGNFCTQAGQGGNHVVGGRWRS